MVEEAMRIKIVNAVILALIVFASINLVVWLWVIDFALSVGVVYLYVPYFYWDKEISKGVAANIGYWNICISFTLAVISAYILGSRELRSKRD